jgi:hypothetical protein
VVSTLLYIFRHFGASSPCAPAVRIGIAGPMPVLVPWQAIDSKRLCRRAGFSWGGCLSAWGACGFFVAAQTADFSRLCAGVGFFTQAAP